MHVAASIVAELGVIVGKRYVFNGSEAASVYTSGFRFGGGSVSAVVRPGSLLEMWEVVKYCVASDIIVIPQAANTGLTGGSTPFGYDYDRPVVILNTMRIRGIHMLHGGKQVVCLAGATLHDLEARLAAVGREPHSVIGSSCIGASVVGGICNNSGGSLIRRGPAYTELALFAQVDECGSLKLYNHLGIDLGESPDQILANLELGRFSAVKVDSEIGNASDHEYARHVRDVNASSPSRFNADPRRLYQASGSAGKLIVFAVRLDTFSKESSTSVFYIGSNSPGALSNFRRCALESDIDLPIAVEYMHREAFDIAREYGKDVFLVVRHFGTRCMPTLFSWASKFDSALARLGLGRAISSAAILQLAARLAPEHLPRRMLDYRDKYEHHLIVRVPGPLKHQYRDLIAQSFSSPNSDFFECTQQEGEKAFLHRFVTAGAAIRCRQLNIDVEDVISLDIALPRNASVWLENLPDDLHDQIHAKIYYAHFFCFVFHQDYVLKRGVNANEFKNRVLELLDVRGAEYPAEHNVGHLYKAKSHLSRFYKDIDPCNQFNPGIGGNSKCKCWREINYKSQM
jgi:D-lactate dehydrogenase